MKFNVPGKLVVPRINRNNEVENTGYMLNELMKAKVNRLRLSVRSYINPTEQNKPLELQLKEYTAAFLTFRDSIFGSDFYGTTCLHGLHVTTGSTSFGIL